MRSKFHLLLTLLALSFAGNAQQLLDEKINVGTGRMPDNRNAVIYLPADYSATKRYPLVIYSHANSQAGTDVNKLYSTGLPKVLRNGYRPAFDFIMVAPQSASYSVKAEWLEGILQDAKKRWPIDTNRVYLTGIDAGGYTAYGSQLNITKATARKFTAIVIGSGATQSLLKTNLDWWQETKTPLWAVVGGRATLTVRPGYGHDGWNDIYSGKVKVDNKDMWQWLYQFDRSAPDFPTPATTTLIAKDAEINAITGITSSTSTTTGTKIEAESYGSMYGVQKETTTDVGGGQNVGYIDNGDWMRYAINAPVAGTYTFSFRVATAASGAQFKVKNSAGTVLATVNVPTTGGAQIWRDVTAAITLPAGAQSLTITSANLNRWNFNYFTLPAALSETPVEVPVGTTSGTFRSGFRLEAENFTTMYGVLKQTANDFGGGVQNLFDFNLNDWASYTINVATPGMHTLNFRVACGNTSGAKFTIRNGSGTILATVDVPYTGGNQVWRDLTAIVNLAAGTQPLVVKSASSSGWNFNFFECVKTPLNPFASYIIRRNSGNAIYLPKGLNLKDLKPGDTLNIPAGTYNVIDMGNFRGNATHHVIIRNKGGLVTTKWIRFPSMPEYFSLLGNGHPGLQYGFKIDGQNSVSSCVSAYGTDIEVAYVEMMNAKTGFFMKCNPTTSNPLTIFPNYVMKNIYLHHNYIHDIDGEAMYIGHTGADGGQDGNMLIPTRMQNVEIAYNILDRIAWDGIQLANATTGNKIHHNTITNFGTINKYGQQAGILLGGNSSGDIYDNIIKNGSGNGIQNFGFGLNKIYNNYIENVGRNGPEKGVEAVFCNDIIIKSEVRPKQEIQAFNNTIKYPKSWGAIRVSGYNENSLPAKMQYNKVLLPNAPADWEKLYFPTYVKYSTISGNTLIK
jgi:endoglucanase